MATDIPHLLLQVADANSAIEEAIETDAVTPAVAQELLLLLEESMHQVVPLALSETKRQLVLVGTTTPE